MPTKEEEKLVEDYNRDRLRRSNDNIRSQIAAGVPARTLATRINPENPDDGMNILAAMSIAETHDMPVGQSMAVTPGVLTDAFGEGFSIDGVIGDLFGSQSKYDLPTKPISAKDVKAQVATEEAEVKSFTLEEMTKRSFLTPYMDENLMEASATSAAITRAAFGDKLDFGWLQQDPSKESFYEGMIDAETDIEKEAFRKDRFNTLFSREQDRLERVSLWQDNLEQTNLNPPGFFKSKMNAVQQGYGNVGAAELDITSDLVRATGKVVGSKKMTVVADNISQWATAYHKAVALPDVSFKSINTFDKVTNNLMANAPYTGTMVAAAVLSPDKLTPFTTFIGAFTMASSSIKQTALDNGFSQEEANLRGWIGAIPSAALESVSGGAAKYNPKGLIGKIGATTKKLTKNVAKEIFMEEIPQQVIEDYYGEDTPRNKDGSIDWDEVTQRYLELSRDTAAMSLFWGSSGMATGQALAYDERRTANKENAKSINDAMDMVIEESNQQDGKIQPTIEEIVEQEVEAQQRESIKAQRDAALAQQKIDRKESRDKAVAEAKQEGAAAKEGILDIDSELKVLEERDDIPEVIVGETQTFNSRSGLKTGKVVKVDGNEVTVNIPVPDIKAGANVRVDARHAISPTTTAEVAVEQVIAKEADDIKIETTPVQVPINEQVKNTTRYGVVLEGQDAKGKDRYTVINWETQQEVQTGLGKRFAINEATKLNTGETQVSISRATATLPTSQDIETMTHTQLLRTVFTAVSKNARKVAIASAKNQVARGGNIANMAKARLQGLDITESQRNSLIKKAGTARTPTQELQAMQTIETIREISRKRAGTQRFKQIRSMVNKKSKLKLRDGGIHHTAASAIGNLLDKYTSVSGRTLNAIKRAQTYLDGIREGVEGDFGADFAQAVMPKGLTSKFSEIMATPIKDLSADELDGLNTTMERYLRQAQLWGKLLQTRQARELKNFLNNATDGIKLKEDKKAVAGEKIKRGKLKKIVDFGTIKNDDIYTIATKIWGRNDPIGRIIRQSRRNQLALSLKYANQLRTIIAETGIDTATLKSWSGFMHDTNLEVLKKTEAVPFFEEANKHTVNIGGTDRDFTMAEAMAFAMHVKNSYNLDKIVRNGISTTRQHVGQMTKEEIQEVLQIVETDSQASAFVDSLNVFYAETAADINKVSRELDGIDIATIDDYFHIEYETTGGVAGTQYVRDSMVDEEYINKFRVDSPHPVVVRDIFQVVGQDINVVSNFAGTTEAVRKLRSLANYKPFRKKMVDAGSKHILGELDNRIRQFQQTRNEPSTDFERGVESLTTGVSRAILTSPMIWALQPTSAMLYFTEVSGKYSSVLFKKSSPDSKRDMGDNWTLLAARKAGIGSSKSIATKSEVKRTFTGSGTAADKQLAVLHKADIVGVTNAGKLTMAEMADRSMSGVSQEWWQDYGVNPNTLTYGSDDYWQAFNDRADYLVTLTQPMFFSENKSALTGSSNPLARAFFRFRSFIDQIGRILRRQTDMLRYGEISKVEYATNTGIALTLISVVTPLMKSLWDLIRGKEVKGEDIVRNMLSAPLGIIPLAGYPLQKIANTLTGANDNFKPNVSAMPLMMADRILEHMWETARGVNYMFDDEIIQSGPNRGKNKSEVWLKRGIGGAASDMLMINGVPTRTIEQIEWFNETK